MCTFIFFISGTLPESYLTATWNDADTYLDRGYRRGAAVEFRRETSRESFGAKAQVIERAPDRRKQLAVPDPFCQQKLLFSLL